MRKVDISMVVAFLDLLGFSSLIKRDSVAARDQLDMFHNILRTRFFDEKTHPIEEHSDEHGLRQFAENNAVTSFSHLISFSDSLVIGSEQPDLFVRQISNFVYTAFMSCAEDFNEPIINMDTLKSKSRMTVALNNEYEATYIQHGTAPLLFRGGITAGTEVFFNREGRIWNGELSYQAVNVSGLDYIRAYKLEATGAGPRLFCDKKFLNELTDDTKKAVRYVKDDIYEIVWTYFGCEAGSKSSNPVENAMNQINRRILPPALHLYDYYSKADNESGQSSDRVKAHYQAFVELICCGIYKYIHDNGCEKNCVLTAINKHLEQHHFGWIVSDRELDKFCIKF